MPPLLCVLLGTEEASVEQIEEVRGDVSASDVHLNSIHLYITGRRPVSLLNAVRGVRRRSKEAFVCPELPSASHYQRKVIRGSQILCFTMTRMLGAA